MKKLLSFFAAALVSMAVMAGANDLLWDYTQSKIPTTSPDNGLYYASYVNDAPSSNNGLNGVKLSSSGWAYFEKAAVAGKLTLTVANRKAQTAYAVSVYNATKAEDANPVKGTKIADTEDVEFGASATIDLPAEATGIYIERKTGAEGVLSKIEFKENVARSFVDFKIEFRNNPYTVLLPESGELPEGVVVAGTNYNGGQHGIYGGSITVPVDGTVKFTIGGCQYSSSDITVKKDGEVYATVSNKIAKCGKTTGVYEEDVPYIYMGGAGVLTFEIPGNTYIPYFFAEAAEVTPCEIIFKDQNGKELGRVATIEGAKLEAIPYTVDDLPAIAAGDAFRGWYYVNGKRAQIGDVISGNTFIQAKVTPIESATVGSVQDYPLSSAIFYPEDHETISMDGGYFHDATHGWAFKNGESVTVDVAGNAVLVLEVCQYGNAEGKWTLTKGDATVGSIPAVDAADGHQASVQYTGEAGQIQITLASGGECYLHKITVYNVLDFPKKDEKTGYYIVPSGDAASFILTLVQAVEGDKIFLPNGTYDLGERVLTQIGKNNIAIIGQSMEDVIIRNAPDASTESIDKTATIKIAKNVQNTYLQDLTIQNALDYYKADNGRAVALWDQGTKTICKNVRLLSYQDTYYSNLQGAVKYFEDCEIHGTVDFICGDGSVYFKKNLLYCEKRKAAGGGSDALTANNGPATDKGYVFESCTVKSECPTVSFGRAWNNTPSVAFLNTLVDYSAGEFGFSNSDIQRWTKKLMNQGAWPQFGEFNTHLADGTVLTPGSNVVKFIDKEPSTETRDIETILSAEQAAVYTMEYTLGAWSATAAADAAQAVCDMQNIEAESIYLVEVPNGNAILYTGAELAEEIFPDDSDVTARKANARGGFGKPVSVHDQPSGIESIQTSEVSLQKILRDGQIVIVKDGKTYNTLGVELK